MLEELLGRLVSHVAALGGRHRGEHGVRAGQGDLALAQRRDVLVAPEMAAGLAVVVDHGGVAAAEHPPVDQVELVVEHDLALGQDLLDPVDEAVGVDVVVLGVLGRDRAVGAEHGVDRRQPEHLDEALVDGLRPVDRRPPRAGPGPERGRGARSICPRAAPIRCTERSYGRRASRSTAVRTGAPESGDAPALLEVGGDFRRQGGGGWPTTEGDGGRAGVVGVEDRTVAVGVVGLGLGHDLFLRALAVEGLLEAHHAGAHHRPGRRRLQLPEPRGALLGCGHADLGGVVGGGQQVGLPLLVGPVLGVVRRAPPRRRR